jgi:hypothetical protein
MKTYKQIMKSAIEETRQELQCGLSVCSEDQQMLFKRMYSPDDLGANIYDVVDKMPRGRLERAMEQVVRTIEKNKERNQ